ncbi:MAG TPA: zinc ABC transporter substrate-binding protein, partial [Hyphomicrobium sp.]|nr:zinc ABC transporter substrate-binding protein [Hyphomicrobium sp.]
QYFDARFGLDVVGSITVSPDVKPSAKRLTELRKRIRDLKAVCVFAEPLNEPRLVAAVIEDTGARSGTLDPEGMGLEPGAGLYFALMRNLASAIKSCLAPAT